MAAATTIRAIIRPTDMGGGTTVAAITATAIIDAPIAIGPHAVC
jgi:hypothetical protein